MRTIAFLYVKEWKFVGPIFAGDTVRLKSRVIQKTPRGRGRRGEMHWYRAIYNQEGKIVQEGTLVTMVEARAMHQQPISKLDESASPEAE